MADLGEAVLKLTVDDSELKTRLADLRKELETLSSAGTRGTRSTSRTSRGGGGAVDPGQIDALAQAARELNLNTNWGKALRVLAEVDNDLALIAASQQFNLANSWNGALTQLTEIQQDLALVAGGERLNLNTSWGAALAQLSEIDADLKLVSAGERINLNSSWTAALGQLREIDGDLKLVAAGEQLNLNASWASALDQLREIDNDLKLVASGEQLNLNSSWTSALEQLREIDGDLKLLSASEQLNLRASWTAALEQLREVDADLRFIAAGQDLNLRTSWTTALSELAEIDADLRLISGGRQLNLATSWGNFLQQLEDTKLDLDRARGGPSSPVSGRLSNGGAIPGSPAAGRDAYNEARGQLEEALQQQIARRVNSSEAIVAEQQRIIAEARREVAASKKLAAAKDKAAKAEAAAAQQRSRDVRKRLGEAAGNALIGGAFPALFGQGLGASIGGAAGGGLGGLLGGNFGFGLSLVGTALGQRFDDINKALENPIANFEQLKTAGALSSKSLEKYAEGLIETGRTAEAAALIQNDLADTFGADSLSAFAQIRSASDELNRSFGEAAGTVGAFVAGPLAAFLKGLSGQVDQFSVATRFEGLVSQLNPDQYRQVRDVTDRATRDAQRARGGAGFLPPSEADVTKGRQAGIEAARQILGIKDKEKKTEQEISKLQAQSAKQILDSYKLIDAQLSDNPVKKLEQERVAVENERTRKLQDLRANGIASADPRSQQVNQDADRQIYKLDQQIQREQKLLEIRRRSAQEVASSFRLIAAEVDGNRTAQLNEREIQAVAARDRALQELATQGVGADDPRVQEANIAAAKELYRIQRERLKLERELALAQKQSQIKRGLQFSEIQIGLSERRSIASRSASDLNPADLGAARLAGIRDGGVQYAQARLRIETAIAEKRKLQALYEAEQDPTERAKLAEEIKSASNNIVSAGISAGNSLAGSAARAAKDIKGAGDSIRSLREQNFRLLPNAQRQQLLESARADVERGRRSGILRDTFRTGSRSRLFEAASFVRGVEPQQALIVSNQALIEALDKNARTERNLSIRVLMNADGTYNVSQAEQQAALL